jgi:PEGA domain./Curli production assembly/transport component CsgG.
MKRTAPLLCLTAALLSGCATIVKIDSNVEGAEVIFNGEHIGRTPVHKACSDFVFNSYDVIIEKEGYETYRGSLKKELKVFPLIISPVFSFVPLLWCYGPQPGQYFELQAASALASAAPARQASASAEAPRAPAPQAASSGKVTLSVLEFKVDQGNEIPGLTGKDLALFMETYLSQESKYELSNRLYLDEVMSEKELQATDVFSTKFTSSLSSFKQAKKVLVGQVKKFGEGYNVFVRVIDLETNVQGPVHERGSIYIASEGLNAVKAALRALAQELTQSETD